MGFDFSFYFFYGGQVAHRGSCEEFVKNLCACIIIDSLLSQSIIVFQLLDLLA